MIILQVLTNSCLVEKHGGKLGCYFLQKFNLHLSQGALARATLSVVPAKYFRPITP
jgi:hypothetical protein